MAAESNSVILTQDLRSASQDYKRDSEHKHKWELGEARGPGRTEEAPTRPRKPVAKPKTHKGQAAKGTHHKHIVADHREVASDSSCDEDVDEPTAAPDAEITYSFDAPYGPNHGSQVLAAQLERAVAKFENSVTEKLVRDEYELLNSNGESVLSKPDKRSGKQSHPHDDDDYEFV